MNKLLSFKVFFLLLYFFSVRTHCYSCTCVGEKSVRVEIKQSDVVIVGKVLKREILSFATKWDVDSLRKARYTIDVFMLYKGKLGKHKQVTIITGLGKGDCGFQFEIGEEYIIYANYKKRFFTQGKDVPKFLYTDRCKRTCKKDANELSAIGKCRKPHVPK